ncbi:TPA: Ig-like domain-containing protein, partial [Streptococcus suis]
MYFNRKNSQQKNWRMIKKGKHFLFGCALVFTLGATTNVAGAETIITEATTVDQAQDSTAVSEEVDSEAATSTAVSEVASSTSATSEVASETVATSTVATSENSELASTTSEAVTSENSESASVASSEAASSETASSTTVEAASEVSETVSASETAVANRTAFIGYEVQYTTSTGEVVGKTANIVATDTTDAVATSTLTVAATDVPAGYELAAEQAYSLTQQISENQINILSFAVVKKSEEEEIAESQLANKTVLEQVISEAIVLSDEALRQVATTQAGNTELEAAATSTQETIDNAIVVLEDASATQEQVDSQVEAVKASTSALAEEMLKVDEDGNLTVALSTISTSTNGLVPSNYVTTSYEVKDGYVYWTHILNSGFVNKDNYSYSFTLPKAVGSMEDVVMQRIDRNNNVVETKTTWTNNSGDEGSNGMQFIKNINKGSAGALYFDRQNQIQAAIDRTGFAGSKEILDNSQTNYYGIKTDSNVNNNYKYKVTFRTPIVDENLPLDYIVTGNAATKVQGSNVVVGQYNTPINESPEVSAIGSDGTQLYPDRSTNKYLFVFGTTEGTTETETGATSTAPGFNKDNAAVVTTMTDADGINSISYDDASIVENPQTSLGSNLILGTDGKLEGTFDHTAGGFYSRRAIVTDNAGSTTKSNVFFTYAYTDKETDTTPVEKTNGSTVTETEIYSKLAIATTSDAYQNTDYNVPTVPETEYTRSIVGYRTVGSTDVTEATVDTLPTTGEYEVRVKTTNIYGQEIYNWVTVKYPEAPVPEFYNQQKVDKGQNQNQLNDMLVWRNTEMTTPYQLPIKDNGVAIDEIYYVEADTAATEKITVDNLTISNTGVVTGSASFTGEPKTVEAVIKSGTTLVQSEQAWIVVMDAQGSTINKNEGETVSNEEILDAVTVDWGGYDPTWEFGEAGLTKEVITPTLPTSGQNNVVKVKLTNAQGQEKIVDVIVNWPVNIQAIDQYNITWDNQSVSGRTDEGFEFVQDEKGNKVLIYKYDLDNHTAFSMDDVLKQLNATPKDSSSGLRTLDGIEKSKIENNQEGYTTDWNTAKLNGQTIDFLDVVNPDPLWGGRKVVDSTTDSNTKHSTFYIPGTTDIGTASNSVTVGGTNGVDTITVTDNNRNLYSNQVDRQKLYIRSTPASTEDGTNSAVDNDTDTDTIPVYMVGYKNNTPTTGTNKKPLYVFNNTSIATVGAGTDVADNVNKVNVVTLEDPQGINSVEVTRETDVNTTVFNPSSIGITIDTDGNASGTPSVGPIGAYSRGLTVTDGTGAKTNLFPRNNEMETYVLDATAGATITKAVGESVTEAEILDNVTVVTGNSNTMDAAIDSRYRKVLAPGQEIPTTPGTHTVNVRVITESNVYKDVPVTVIIPKTPDTTAPEAPVVDAKEDGSVTVTPAGDDTKTTAITYTDENGTPQTVTVTKGEDGNWTVPAESGVTVDSSTGAVTIPADKVQDGSTVSATSTDEAGNTSSPATDIAKDNPDTTAPEAPVVTANPDGTVTVTPSTTAGDDTKTVDITYTDENGTPQKVTVTKGEDGNWTVPAESGVTVDPSTGAVTIPADKVQDGSTVSATSTDEAGNTSSTATDTAKNNPDTTAPEAPSVVANDDGTVTVTPSTTAGDDTKTVDITYTDENGTEQTVTVTKEDDGTWTVPADSGVTVDPTTGAVTIPADKVQDGSTVSATSTDEAGNTSNPATDTAKNNPDTTAPESPSVVANEDGTVTVTPSTTAGDDTKTVDITYTDENGTEQTVTVTKEDDGTWSVPADSGVTVDPTTGAVTIPADKVQDGSTVSATSTDEAGNTSNPATDTAKNNPDTTAPEAPSVVANEDGTVTVTPSTTAGDDTKTVDITYTDENGTEQKVTVTKEDDGTWSVPADSGVTVDPTTGAVTIPADKVQDGSTVSATSTDEAGNTSSPATDTAKDNPDTTAPEAPVVNAPKEGDTTVTGTTEPGATVTVTFPDGTTVTTTADENG